MIEKFKEFLSKNEFLRNTLLVGGGTLLAQVISMATIPILTRIYTPNDFGMLQTFQYVAIYFISIASLKFDVAVLIPKDEASYRKVLITAILSIFTVSSISLGVVGIMHYFSFYPFFFQNIRYYLWLLPLVTFVSGFFLLFHAVLIRMKLFGILGRSKIFQTMGASTTQLSLGFLLSFNSIGLILGDAAGRFVGLLSFSKILFYEIKKTISYFSISNVLQTFREYQNFPKFTTPGTILNISGYAIPVLLFGSYYGTAALGFYTLVNTLFTGPMVLIGTSVSQVLSSDTSKLYIENPRKLYDLFVKIIKRLSLISIVPVIVLFIFAPQLFSFVFGEAWENSGHYFRVLAPLQFFGFIVGPLTPTLNLIGEQKWQFAWEVSRFVVSGILIVVVYLLAPSAMQALLCYSLLMALFYILHLLLSLHFIRAKNKKDNSLIQD